MAPRTEGWSESAWRERKTVLSGGIGLPPGPGRLRMAFARYQRRFTPAVGSVSV